ncbi:MAG: nicotinate-nucleotide--dimethylbenzimidazole phosphoribosyltransferase [Deltaproteobacteria bacterium]|nr:nicotinate-nucleotide--dimethylbenzimidazole phosphoribosyltransferase [Deltaproteobacteria bacterium]
MGLLEQTLSRTQPLDLTLAGRVQTHLDHLTNPRGSLDRLEELALRCALITGRELPQVTSKVLFVCCADHGVCAEGVSAYPREVTAQMVYNSPWSCVKAFFLPDRGQLSRCFFASVNRRNLGRTRRAAGQAPGRWWGQRTLLR